MAPVTPVIMRVLRPRCYRHRLAVHGIATRVRPKFQVPATAGYRYRLAVYGIAKWNIDDTKISCSSEDLQGIFV